MTSGPRTSGPISRALSQTTCGRIFSGTSTCRRSGPISWDQGPARVDGLWQAIVLAQICLYAVPPSSACYFLRLCRKPRRVMEGFCAHLPSADTDGCQAVLTPYLSDKILGLRGLEIGQALRGKATRCPLASATRLAACSVLKCFSAQARSDGRWRSPALWAASSSQRGARSSAGGPTAQSGKDRPVGQNCLMPRADRCLPTEAVPGSIVQDKHLTAFHADSSQYGQLFLS